MANDKQQSRSIFHGGTCLLALAAICIVGCERSAQQPITPRSVIQAEVGGVQRSYILRLPTSYDGQAKLPLVILLHGATDSAEYAEAAYHFVEKANEKKFILILPDAIGASHAWNGLDADAPESPNNDLAFLDMILSTIPKSYAVDNDRIFVCGHSSGAIMSYRLAAERPDLIAAAGIVAGTVGNSRSDPPRLIPEPHGPVPLILFHGKLDPTLPYDGTNPGIASVAESVAFWAKANHCAASPSRSEEITPAIRRDSYDSPVHADIVLYTLENGNHMWPGGNIMPGKDQKPVQDISATDLMWNFFEAHPRSARAAH